MSAHSALYGRIFSNVSFLTIGRLSNAVCSFAYITLAIRALGLHDFGILVLIHSLGTTSSTLCRTQSWQTLIQYGDKPYKAGDTHALRQVIGFCIRLDILTTCAAIVTGVIAVSFYSSAADWTHQDRMLAFAYLLVYPFMYTGWAQGVLRLTGRFRLVPISDATTALFRTAGAATGFFAHMGLPFFVCVWGCTVVLDYTLYTTFALVVLRRCMKLQLSWKRVLTEWRWRLNGMWSFTRSTSINQTLGLLAANVSTLVVGRMIGPADAAIFRICRQIADGIVTPAQLLSPVLFPELARLRAENNWRALVRVTWKIFGILCAVSVILLIISATVGNQIFSLMLHTRIEESSWYISIMLVAAAFSLLIVPLEPMLIVMGQVSRLVVARTVILVLYFPTLIILTKFFSVTGACFAAAICSFAVLVFWLWSAFFCSRRATQHPQR